MSKNERIAIVNQMAEVTQWSAPRWRAYIIKELEVNGVDYAAANPVDDYIMISRCMSTVCHNTRTHIKFFFFIRWVMAGLKDGQTLTDMRFLMSALRSYMGKNYRAASATRVAPQNKPISKPEVSPSMKKWIAGLRAGTPDL